MMYLFDPDLKDVPGPSHNYYSLISVLIHYLILSLYLKQDKVFLLLLIKFGSFPELF